jgi:hypothetical protein
MFGMVIIGIYSEVGFWYLEDLISIGLSRRDVVHNHLIFFVKFDFIWVVFDTHIDACLRAFVFCGQEVIPLLFVIEQVVYYSLVGNLLVLAVGKQFYFVLEVCDVGVWAGCHQHRVTIVLVDLNQLIHVVHPVVFNGLWLDDDPRQLARDVFALYFDLQLLLFYFLQTAHVVNCIESTIGFLST